MSKLEIDGNLIALYPGSSQLFTKNGVITKYEVEQNSIHFLILVSFIIIFMAHYTTSNASFKLKSKCSNHIVFSMKMFFWTNEDEVWLILYV